MPLRKCWFCGGLANMSMQASRASTLERKVVAWGALSCNNCGALNIAAAHTTPTLYRGSSDGLLNDALEAGQVQWFPKHSSGKEFPDVPDDIAETASEAHECFSVEAYRGAMILARLVIEVTAHDKGASGKDLKEKIDSLGVLGYLRPHIVTTAHAVRAFGNATVHGDRQLTLTREDAQVVLDLMDEVLNEVYQSPAKLAAAVARAAAIRPPKAPTAKPTPNP